MDVLNRKKAVIVELTERDIDNITSYLMQLYHIWTQQNMDKKSLDDLYFTTADFYCMREDLKKQNTK